MEIMDFEMSETGHLSFGVASPGCADLVIFPEPVIFYGRSIREMTTRGVGSHPLHSDGGEDTYL